MWANLNYSTDGRCRDLLALGIAAGIGYDVSANSQADLDPVKAVEREDDRVYQDDPGGEDQAQDAHQPGQAEVFWRARLTRTCGERKARKRETANAQNQALRNVTTPTSTTPA